MVELRNNKLPRMSSDKIRTGLRTSITEGIFAQVHINLTAGMFLTSYALYIGLNDFGIGFLSAIPAFFTGFAFLSIYLVKIFGSRRRLCVLFSGIGRGVFLLFGITLQLRIPVSHSIFFILIAIHNILMNIAGNAWQSWMSDLVPKERRGRYFGVRNTLLNLVGMITNIIGGKILDIHRLAGSLEHGLGLLFTGASVSSTTAAIVLNKQPEPHSIGDIPHLIRFIKAPLKDVNFVNLLKFISFWYLLAGIASPFYLVHMITNLNMSYTQIAFYSIIAGVMGMLCQIVWGKAIDRFKSKPVLTFNFFGAAFLPLLWLFASIDNLWPLWIDALFTGVFWSGINLSLFNIVFSLTDEKKLKESYFAVFTAISGVCGFMASLLGGLIAQILSSMTIHILGMSLVNYHLLFAFASVVRFISLFFLSKVEEREAYPTIITLQFIGDYALKRLVLYKDLLLNTVKIHNRKHMPKGNSQRH
jgi:MFS family permease